MFYTCSNPPTESKKRYVTYVLDIKRTQGAGGNGKKGRINEISLDIFKRKSRNIWLSLEPKKIRVKDQNIPIFVHPPPPNFDPFSQHVRVCVHLGILVNRSPTFGRWVELPKGVVGLYQRRKKPETRILQAHK